MTRSKELVFYSWKPLSPEVSTFSPYTHAQQHIRTTRTFYTFVSITPSEAAVKHILLESENPKYLGTDDSMINVGLMTKLYHVVAHNLNESKRVRDGNKKGKTPKEPKKLKVGNNILVRDHTSKAFQPKYKDFCIVGLLGKNQVEIKDNHGHTTKVHLRDVKIIPMMEKVCKLYEEEQIGKTREGRKAIPTNKMPDLGRNIAETQLAHEKQENNDSHKTPPLQTLVTVIIMLITILEYTTIYANEIAKKTVQAVKSTITKASHNELLQNIKDSYKTATLVVAIVTNMTDCTNLNKRAHMSNGNMQKHPDMQKLNDEYDGSYQSHTPRTHSYSGN